MGLITFINKLNRKEHEMRNLQYELPISIAEAAAWGDCRNTDSIIAMAIHAIADDKRSPDEIWVDATSAERDHVLMALENYIDNGIFPAAHDGNYRWGSYTITLPE